MQQGFFVKTEDNGRIHNPYGSALLVDEHNEGLYSLVIPLEGIPTVVGDVETFAYNILTDIGKGQTKGKMEVETATTDFFLTKENCHRLDQLKGKILPYMIFYGNNMGLKFNAEISYRPNDVDNGDNLKGTLTITPSSIDGDLIFNACDQVRQTLQVAGTVPAEVIFHTDSEKVTYGCEIANGEKVTAKTTFITSESGADKYTATWEDGTLTINASTDMTNDCYALLQIDFTDSTKMSGTKSKYDKYAPYTMFIDLFFDKVAE